MELNKDFWQSVAVVIAFFFCWAPFHTQRLLYVHAKDSIVDYVNINEIIFLVSGIKIVFI